MGYNTRFTGKLTFTTELTVPMLRKLQSFFGEDARNHPEWGIDRLTYIDLVMSKDLMGIEWDSGTEKTYGLEHAVNLILREMRKEWPEFGLEGSLLAQGEEVEDRWHLVIDDGHAKKVKADVQGVKVRCPHCNRTFFAAPEQSRAGGETHGS